MSTGDYNWTGFYSEFAKKLLEFKDKDNRKELINKIIETFNRIDIKMPTLEKENNIVDIDPFTIFGLFNKSSMKYENRKKIISGIKETFNLKNDVPDKFDSIPVLNNINATYYSFIEDRDEKAIDNLWELFSHALEYEKSPTEEILNKLKKYFDLAIDAKHNGNSKITMGLFWIAPSNFLNLDIINKWYIYESGKLPKSIVDTLPKVDDKISSDKYFEILEKVKEYLDNSNSEINNFKDLSFNAWLYSNEVKKSKKGKEENNQAEEKVQAKAPTLIEDKDSEYSKEKFLEEVYINEKDYNTLVQVLKKKKNIILRGVPGVGKTFIAKRLAYSLLGEKNQEKVKLVQFHQSYSYEDFIEGFRPSSYGKGFEIKKGSFYKFCKEASEDLDNNYYFIIDEINRGNLSKIFGELFMLIENDKRGNELQLLYSDEKFKVPANVYIIGTMNTADRSLALLDYALRRRFAFFDIKPGFNTDGFTKYKNTLGSNVFDKVIKVIEEINKEIEYDEALGKGFCIGHSYFCNIENAEKELPEIIEFEIIPLLEEYCYDDQAKVDRWAEKLREKIK